MTLRHLELALPAQRERVARYVDLKIAFSEPRNVGAKHEVATVVLEAHGAGRGRGGTALEVAEQAVELTPQLAIGRIAATEGGDGRAPAGLVQRREQHGDLLPVGAHADLRGEVIEAVALPHAATLLAARIRAERRECHAQLGVPDDAALQPERNTHRVARIVG